MSLVEIILLSISLAMDAFAVSICKGLSMKKINWKKAIIIGLYFGIFQSIMPAIGYFLGTSFERFITSIDHWIAFGLLFIIGANMIRETLSEDESSNCNDDVSFKVMIVLAIATSIDALAAGITFAFLDANPLLAIILIGVITFVISILGVKIGNKFGDKYEKPSGIAGGIILILLGLKILLQHLGILVLPF